MKSKCFAILEINGELKQFKSTFSRDKYIIDNNIKSGKCYFVNKINGMKLEEGYYFNR